jgi:hypothetical protein
MGFSPEELYEMRRTVTDLGRELHIAYNDLNAAPWLRSKSRKFHHRRGIGLIGPSAASA